MTKEEIDGWLGIWSCWCKIWMKGTDGRLRNDGQLNYDCDINGMRITRSVSSLGREGNDGKMVSIIDYTGAKTLSINPKPG